MPRARKPKVGLMRIDAALDALRPMGFPESLVRRTVGNLLKAYGGDEGWTFIEEFSHKLLLINSILEKLEGENNGPRFLENGASKTQAIQGDCPSNNSSSSPFVPCPLESENSQVKHKISAGVSSSELFSLPAVESKQVQSSSSQSSPPPKKRAIRVDSAGNNSLTLVNAVPCSSKSITSQSKLEEQFTSLTRLSSPQLFSPPTVESHSARRHKPYYGWISSDDEEEPDLVYLRPATSHPPCSY